MIPCVLGGVLAIVAGSARAARSQGTTGSAAPLQRPIGMHTEISPTSPAAPVVQSPTKPATTPSAKPAIQTVAPRDAVTTPTAAGQAADPVADPAADPAANPPADPPTQSAATSPTDSPRATPPSPSATASPSSGATTTPSPDAALARPASPPPSPFPHHGFVADLRVGMLGCVGGLCASGRHAVKPGARIGGFLGGNVRGWFELGLDGGWGTMRADVTPGTNALTLYGLEPALLQNALVAAAAGALAVDLRGLVVEDASLRAAQLGPAIRIHLVPRGRFGAFVGSGVGYNLLRARYQTAAGDDIRLDFHGIEVPLQANFSVYLRPRIALGVQLDYLWTFYGVAVLDHPAQRVALPLTVLQAAGARQGVDFRDELPQLWTVGLALRGRL